jgi:hypothetical protein
MCAKLVLQEKDDQIERLAELVKLHRVELQQLTDQDGYSHSMMMLPLQHYLCTVDFSHRMAPSFQRRKEYLEDELRTIARMFRIVKDFIAEVDAPSTHTRMEILANHLHESNEALQQEVDELFDPSFKGDLMMGKWQAYKISNHADNNATQTARSEPTSSEPHQN